MCRDDLLQKGNLSTVISSVLGNAIHHSGNCSFAFRSILQKLVVAHAEHDFTQPLEALRKPASRLLPFLVGEIVNFRPVFTIIGLDLSTVDASKRDVRP